MTEYEKKRDEATLTHAKYLQAALDVHPACLVNTMKDFRAGYDEGFHEGQQAREREIFETLNRMAIAFDYGTNEAVMMVRDHLKKCLEVDDKERKK